MRMSCFLRLKAFCYILVDVILEAMNAIEISNCVYAGRKTQRGVNVKIGILSMQRVLNFGSVLQAYSLQKILESIAKAPVQFIDIEEDRVCFSKKTIFEEADTGEEKALSDGVFSKAKRWSIKRISFWNKKKIRKFMRKTFNLTESNNHSNYDAVVVGSDEVFNHRHGVNLQLHGDVKQAKCVFSYAASAGSAMIEDISVEDRGLVRGAMANFSAISVRDTATQKYVQSLYDGNVQHHLDPVLVGDLTERKHRRVWLKNYLLVYAYGHRIKSAQEIDAILKYAKDRGLKSVAVGGSQPWCDMYIPVSPFRLLDYFYHADAVVTDTFHGAIFSVINQKRFAVIVRKTNENKLKGLLEDFTLQNREVQNMDQLAEVLDKTIDYRSVKKILDREKQRTHSYLATELMRCQNGN